MQSPRNATTLAKPGFLMPSRIVFFLAGCFRRFMLEAAGGETAKSSPKQTAPTPSLLFSSTNHAKQPLAARWRRGCLLVGTQGKVGW